MRGTMPWMAPELFPIVTGMREKVSHPLTKRQATIAMHAQSNTALVFLAFFAGSTSVDSNATVTGPWREVACAPCEALFLLNAEEQSQAILCNSNHATFWRAGISLAGMTSFEVTLSVQGRTDDQVTEKVDVFSFGICLWEIWTLGEQVAPSRHVLLCAQLTGPCLFFLGSLTTISHVQQSTSVDLQAMIQIFADTIFSTAREEFFVCNNITAVISLSACGPQQVNL